PRLAADALPRARLGGARPGRVPDRGGIAAEPRLADAARVVPTPGGRRRARAARAVVPAAEVDRQKKPGQPFFPPSRPRGEDSESEGCHDNPPALRPDRPAPLGRLRARRGPLSAAAAGRLLRSGAD